MRRLFDFIRNIYVVVLFVLLEVVAINYYASSTLYTQARLLTRTNQVVGGVHSLLSSVGQYFGLAHDNKLMIRRIVELEEQAAHLREQLLEARTNSGEGVEVPDTLLEERLSQYRYEAARVVSNSINKSHNMLTLNKGRVDGVVPHMSVLTPDGAMVGYVVSMSEHYSVAISALNSSFRVSGKLLGSEYFGLVHWRGESERVVTMTELSKYSAPYIGQKVVTSGFSQYFPADILIGTITSVELNATSTAYSVEIELAAEMTRLDNVILVENRDAMQIELLEQSATQSKK